MSVPVVDFSAYSLREAGVGEEQMRSLSRELHAAFTQVGLVFLQNTGITQEEVRTAGCTAALSSGTEPHDACVCAGGSRSGRSQEVLPAAG